MNSDLLIKCFIAFCIGTIIYKFILDRCSCNVVEGQTMDLPFMNDIRRAVANATGEGGSEKEKEKEKEKEDRERHPLQTILVILK